MLLALGDYCAGKGKRLYNPDYKALAESPSLGAAHMPLTQNNPLKWVSV
jgi:hypothetical protein